MKKSNGVTILIIIAILIFAFVILTKPTSGVSGETAKCIAEKSILYVQKGCVHCANQEKMFGSSYKYLNTIDCFYKPEMCSAITGTPTWVINGQSYVGIQSIERLKQLTECQDLE